jgi:hypothetical protein
MNTKKMQNACWAFFCIPLLGVLSFGIAHWLIFEEASDAARKKKDIMAELIEIYQNNESGKMNQKKADLAHQLASLETPVREKSPIIIILMALGAISVLFSIVVLLFFQRLQFSRAQIITLKLLLVVNILFFFLPGI